MLVNPLVRAVSPAPATAAPAVARKGDPAVTDTAFAAMLAMLIGMPAPLPDPPAAGDSPKQQVQTEATPASPVAGQEPPTLPAAVESLLVSQRLALGADPKLVAALGADPKLVAAVGAGPKLVAALGADPKLVAALGADPKPLAALEAEPRPVAATGAEPKPVAATGAEPKPVAAIGAEPRPVAAIGADPRPVAAIGEQPGANRPFLNLPTRPGKVQVTGQPVESDQVPVKVDVQGPEGEWKVEFTAAPASRADVSYTAAPVKRSTAKTVAFEAASAEPENGQMAALATAALTKQAGRSEAKPATPPPNIQTPIDVDRLMDAIAHTAVSAKDGSYTVTLRLHPENLGEVRLQLQLTGRDVSTVMQVTTPDAKQALQQRGELLRQGLDQAGLTLSGFDVSTGSQGRSPQDRAGHRDELPMQRRRSRTALTVAASAGRSAVPARGRPRMLDTLA